jgi:hypothetical protein
MNHLSDSAAVPVPGALFVDRAGRSPLRKAGVISFLVLLAVLLAVLLLPSCAETGEQEMDLLYQRDVVDRNQAKEMLRMGVRINIFACPENTIAGWYAIQATIPAELNYSHYDGGTVSNCSMLLAVAPCGLDPNASQAIRLNLYNALMQACQLKQVGY